MASESTTVTMPLNKSVGLTDLATELRLQIFRHLFERTGNRCTGFTGPESMHCCSHQRGARVIGTDVPPGLKTCSRLCTAILRVNKQIYHEALPVMIRNVEVLVSIPIYSSASGLNSLFTTGEDVISMVRRVAITTIISDLSALVRMNVGPTMSALEYCCLLAKSRCPNLRELRIQLLWSLYAGRLLSAKLQLDKVLDLVMKHVDNMTVYIGLGAFHHPITREEAPEEAPQELERAKDQAVVDAREKAKTLGKNIAFEIWG